MFCKGDHFNDCCTQYTNVYDRKKQLQRQGRCFVCLRVGHTFKECPSTPSKSCYYCKRVGHHHKGICPTNMEMQVSSNGACGGDKTSAGLSSTEPSLVSPSVLTETSEVPNPVEEESEPVVKKTIDSTAAVSSTLLASGE